MQTETQKPQNQKYNENGPKHVNLILLLGHSFAAWWCVVQDCAVTILQMLMFPSVCAVLLLAGVADHSQIRDCHVTVFSGVFIHIVFFHLRLRVFLHPVGCGI
jgi:hypothetical protein